MAEPLRHVYWIGARSNSRPIPAWAKPPAAFAKHPSKPDAHYRLARLLNSLGREQEAQAEFEKVKRTLRDGPRAAHAPAGAPRCTVSLAAGSDCWLNTG